MIYLTEIFLMLSITAFTILIWHIRRRREHPPGPLGFPIFGLLPIQIINIILSYFKSLPSDSEIFKQRKKKYGPLWSAEFGKQRIIILASWELINEAFIDNGELFSGRPTNKVYKIISHGKGILLTDGKMWHDSRQLAIKSLRDLGMGRKSLENTVSLEAEDMVIYLEKCCSSPVNIMNAFTKGVTNVIMNLVFEERDSYDDSKLEKYVDNLRIIAHSGDTDRQISIAPKLFQTRIMKWLCPVADQFLRAIDYCNQFIRDKCELKMKNYNEDIVTDCVLDKFIRYRFKNSTSLSSEEQREEISQSMSDIFNAGVDTTSNLLTFCCLMLGRFHEVQIDIRNELNEVVGDSGHINLEVKKRCPKVLSFIDEVHRFCCVVPKVHHRVMRECVFHGYKLYPDDIILGDFANIFNDPDLFENPDQFDPYRFTDDSRTKYCPSKYLIPFGIGKRSCLGESIAVMESFIFLVRLIQRFHISLQNETQNHFNEVIKGHSGIIHAPLPYLITLTII